MCILETHDGQLVGHRLDERPPCCLKQITIAADLRRPSTAGAWRSISTKQPCGRALRSAKEARSIGHHMMLYVMLKTEITSANYDND